MEVTQLNNKFAIDDVLLFKQLSSGTTLIEIDSVHAVATISLDGGQVVSWHPKHQAEPVLWVSKRAQYVPGKAIRGGVPVCWPWFGAHPTNAKLPGHGYARITQWSVERTEICDGGSVRVCLSLGESELSKLHWHHKVELKLEIVVGDELAVTLTSTNHSTEEVQLTEGLHTYFNVSDVRGIEVQGLDGTEFVDLTRNNERSVQEGSVTFADELGRIYLNTDKACVIEDLTFKRRIHIEKRSSLSTAVWNPWAKTAATMSDLGVDGWQNMLCVESANALENAVKIPAGASHIHFARYFAEALTSGS